MNAFILIIIIIHSNDITSQQIQFTNINKCLQFKEEFKKKYSNKFTEIHLNCIQE